jgi:long-chain acyl-CoA synthetase
MSPTAAAISEGTDPATAAVIMAASGQTVSLGEVDARSRRLAALLRDRGLGEGDHLAVLLDNHPRYFEVCWAALRAGLYCTPINWHLGPDEAGYILSDCEARALVTTSRMAGVVTALGERLGPLTARLALDGPLEGFEDYERALPDPARGEAWADGREGMFMFYSSGTTGRPKGIQPPLRDTPFGAGTPLDLVVRGLFQFRPGMVYLCPAPLYHAAPIAWSMAAQRVGGTVVVMERFDPEGTLEAIAKYRVTHAQFVPTHFVRMLKLPAATRGRYDLSSLEMVVHAAAPCPVEVKRQMLDWFGPIIHEYYSGSEGMGFCAVGPEEWLRRPGTVGRSLGGPVHITDEDGAELPPGVVGQVWFEATNRFEYHNDPEKTASVFDSRGWGTLGDVGYVDPEGYLFLTDRVSHMIISGGVNIYPQEIEDVLVLHPRVADAGVIGVPDEEMGESVLAVIQPAEAGVDTDRLEQELRELCRAKLAGYKSPRAYRFAPELPRLPTGKLLKRRLREEFGGSSAATVIGNLPGDGHGNS